MIAQKRIKIIVLSLSVMLIAGFASGTAFAAPSAAVDADSSTIRVILSTGDTSEVRFSVKGIYSVSEKPVLGVLAPGNYSVSNSAGSLSLKNIDTATTLASGQGSITLREHANPNGLNLIGLTAKGRNLQYPGAMKFWPDGIYIDVVNHVYLEKYIPGVVENEIGGGFPIEALKAQAVAARSYAVKYIERTRGPRYDITDYANTQAYSGYTSSSKIAQAVAATSKQVLLYNGSVLKAFYSDSNGGITQFTEDSPSYKVQSDPYDLDRGPSQIAGFPVGTTVDKPEDIPTLSLKPIALAKSSGSSLFQRPDTGSGKLAALPSGTVVWIYEMNAAWVKANLNGKIGFIPTRYVTIYTTRAAISASGVRLRSGPSAQSCRILTLPRNASVVLTSYGSWCGVVYNGKAGYVSSNYVKLTKHAAPSKVTLAAGNTLTVLSAAPLKASADTGSNTLLSLAANARVTLVSSQTGWYKVNYNGKTGFVAANSLQVAIPSLVLTNSGFGSAQALDNVSYSQDTMDAKLVAFIKSMAIKSLTTKNGSLPVGQKYIVASDSIKIKAITALTAVSSYIQNLSSDLLSKNCTVVKIGLILKVRKQNSAKQGGYDNVDYSFSFEFNIADTLKSGTNPQWKVFTSGFRIFAVERGKNAGGVDSYNIINRRNGHGVGLSQWGAYRRALDANPAVNLYTSILGFYYPNTTLTALTISEAPLMPVPTPEPTVTSTPRPTEMSTPQPTGSPALPSASPTGTATP